MSTDQVGAVLVCGGGIAGIQASLDLAAGGFKVYLLDSSASIGGRMAQLDRTFPTGECATCILSPQLVECARNRNIEIITLADVAGVSGEAGQFRVRVRRKPRYVDPKKCDACGDCSAVCPVEIPDEFEGGMRMRKAVSRLFSQAIPNVFAISKAEGQAPCRVSCPAGVNVQGFIALLAKGRFREAHEVIRTRSPFPAVCGRVCRHSCEDVCNRGARDESLSIRALERFVADYSHSDADEHPAPALPAQNLSRTVAVVGSGPAGLTAARDLAEAGYTITIFEARDEAGGMLRYGIPGFRLPKEVLDREIRDIAALGVDIRTNAPVTRPKELLKPGVAEFGYDAVFVATGAWINRRLGIPGEDASNVLPGLDFLREVNSGRTREVGPGVLVIGSSDLALDSARSAIRLPGVESVVLACLENRAEMRTDSQLVSQALNEGVVLHQGIGPTRIDLNDHHLTVTFRACTSVYDEYKKFDPIFDDSAVSTLRADTVIIAEGRAVDSSGFGMETRPGGRIYADPETLATGIKGIFAGGDAVSGPASVVDAIAQGHRAAEAIDTFLRDSVSVRSTSNERQGLFSGSGRTGIAAAPNNGPQGQARFERNRPDASLRFQGMNETESGYNREQAILEAERCLACGICSECMECVKACSAKAILHDEQPVEFELEVGSIILSPGAEESEARQEFGLGSYKNVLSAVQFERMLAAGDIRRPSDGHEVRRIAFVQCGGIQEGYCSSICCMTAVQQAMSAIEYSGTKALDVSIFCKELQTAAKDLEAHFNRARNEYGISFVRSFPGGIEELPASRNLKLHYRLHAGVDLTQEFDLIIVNTGIRVPPSVGRISERLGVSLNRHGFARTERFAPLVTTRPGVYAAGVFQEPKDIPDSVAQASGAAACAMAQLNNVRGTIARPHEYRWERDVSDEAPRIGVFVCHCGNNIASIVDVDRVAAKAAKMDGVCYAEGNTYSCSEPSQKHIREMIRKYRLNRLVIASCSSPTHEVLFQETLRETGLNQHLLSIANIRDQCSWVHSDNPAGATAKAIDLVSMAVARARHLKPLPLHEMEVTASALILGGGLAGMTAALNIADQGFKVHLVEKEPVPGGCLRDVHRTLEQHSVQSQLEMLIGRVLSHKKITVHLNSVLTRTGGQVGNFTSVLQSGEHETTVRHGVVVVATGGRERMTEQYFHGKDPRVITQKVLESELAGGRTLERLKGLPAPAVVMIQCVESRDDKAPYCSRICCSEAIKNALDIKRLIPGSSVTIVGRDFRTPGFREQHYREALDRGIRFIRYPDNEPPEAGEVNGTLLIRIKDLANERDVSINPDLLVLSTGIAPASSNVELSGVLRSALSTDGFFLEAHPKIRPVDLASEGAFVCGLAHSPRFIDETIAQAQAAAARAAAILSRSKLEIVGRIAFVRSEACVACTTCVRTCPYGAPVINALKKAEIQGATCVGCGSCVAACPARTITLRHQESGTVVAMLNELVAGGGL